MDKGEIAIGVSVVAVTGILAYLTKAGYLTLKHLSNQKDHITANQAIASDDIAGASGNVAAFLSGPAIYSANTPWLFGANVGNVIPPNSAGVTLPGAVAADFLGFNTQ